MAQKNRNNITAAIQDNVYDNSNKEILASMVRDVLADFRDSYFNLIDDHLKNAMYNNNQTLEQYLNSVVGSKPIYGEVLDVSINENVGESFTTTGLISSASRIVTVDKDNLFEINFNQSVANRRLIPVITYSSGVNWNYANDIAHPIIRRISSTRINFGIRELANKDQHFNIEIIAL